MVTEYGNAVVAQLVEHVIGNDEVGSSILPNGSCREMLSPALLRGVAGLKDFSLSNEYNEMRSKSTWLCSSLVCPTAPCFVL